MWFLQITNPLGFVRIVAKETNLSYHLEKVFEVDIPALHHGNDGLIYTCVPAPYTPGTDRNMCVRFPTPRPSITFLIACVPDLSD